MSIYDETVRVSRRVGGGGREMPEKRKCVCVCHSLMPKCTLINGCSINQWNIIKFQHCDFSGGPQRSRAALSRARGDSQFLPGLRGRLGQPLTGGAVRDPIVSHA